LPPTNFGKDFRIMSKINKKAKILTQKQLNKKKTNESNTFVCKEKVCKTHVYKLAKSLKEHKLSISKRGAFDIVTMLVQVLAILVCFALLFLIIDSTDHPLSVRLTMASILFTVLLYFVNSLLHIIRDIPKTIFAFVPQNANNRMDAGMLSLFINELALVCKKEHKLKLDSVKISYFDNSVIVIISY